MKSLLLCLILGTYVIALENPAPLEIDSATNTQASKVKAAALEKLFATLGQDEFTTALKEAQQADVHPQVLLEARFLNLIDLGDNAAIAAWLAAARGNMAPPAAIRVPLIKSLLVILFILRGPFNGSY